MPHYDYACEKCGHQFETQQKISDAPLKTCPACKADALERLVSRTSFTLKGGGWYADGYGAGSGSGSPASSSSTPSTPTTSAPDAKPASTTPEAKPAAPAKPTPAKNDGGD